MADWNGAREAAKELLKKYSFTQPPVNVFELATDEGLEIVYFDPADGLEDVSGLLDKENRRVYLNANEPPERQNFTLAHELAHFRLDHSPNEYGVYKRDSMYDEEKEPAEKEADAFAAELLMPRDLIEDTLRKYQLGGDDVVVLARLFGVSRSAMSYRLQNLGIGQQDAVR